MERRDAPMRPRVNRVKQRLADGAVAVEFAAFLKAEIANWGHAVKISGARLD